MSGTVASLELRPFRFDEDVDLVHRWVVHPKSVFWEMQHFTWHDVARAYRSIEADPYHHVLIGLHRGTPSFLMERYDPRFGELEGVFDARPSDVGMHFLTAPTDEPIHGFTRAVLRKVMDTLFSDESVSRVIVEPDLRNVSVRRLNALVGFEEWFTITMPRKTASLSICTRENYYALRPSGEL